MRKLGLFAVRNGHVRREGEVAKFFICGGCSARRKRARVPSALALEFEQRLSGWLLSEFASLLNALSVEVQSAVFG